MNFTFESIHSDKVDRARVWGINVVNHFWLEDCFVKWENIGTGNPRYTDYPAGVNYMSSIGRAHLTEESLTRWKEAALAWTEEDEMGAVEQDMQLGGPTQPTPSASTKRHDPPPAHSGLQVDVESDEERDATPKAAGPSRSTRKPSLPIPAEPATKRKKSKAKSPAIDGVAASTETPKRRKMSTPEPIGTSTGRVRRQAATKAGNAVHQMAEDMNLFQKEKHRKDLIPPSERKAARIASRRGAETETEHETDVDMDREEEDETVQVKPTASKRKPVVAKKRAASAKATTEELSDTHEEDVKPDISEEDQIIIATTGVKLTAAQTKVSMPARTTLL